MFNQLLYIVGSAIGLTSFFFTNILFLRSLYLLSSLLFIILGFYFHLTIFIVMNIGYALVNGIQIILLLLSNASIVLPAKFQQVYRDIFYEMRPKEFLYFMHKGKENVLNEDEFICHEGDTQNTLIFMLTGKVSVIKNKVKITELPKHFFIGEMRFLTQKPMSADVIAHNRVEFISWDEATITKLKNTHPDTYRKLLSILGRDLISKLQRHCILE